MNLDPNCCAIIIPGAAPRTVNVYADCSVEYLRKIMDWNDYMFTNQDGSIMSRQDYFIPNEEYNAQRITFEGTVEYFSYTISQNLNSN